VYSAKPAAAHCKGANGNTDPSSANGVSTQENQGIIAALTKGLMMGNDAKI